MENKDLDILNFVLFINETFKCYDILDVGTNNCNLSYILNEEGYNVDAMDYFTKEEMKTYEKFGINCINDYFKIDTNLDNYDLVIAYHACLATELIIRNCIKNDKEFAVVLCEINKCLEEKEIKSRNDYVNYFLDISDKIRTTTLPLYKDEHPSWKEIIYYKKEN